MSGLFDEFGAMAVALGILTFALFPLAVPMILLTVVPLAVAGLALGLVAGVAAAPVLLARRLLRSAGRSR